MLSDVEISEMLIDLRSFIKLVDQMRIAQRKYFRFRLAGDLMEAKRYESEVDEQLVEFKLPTRKAQLFE